MKFIIPLPPQRANARGHWRRAHNAKLAYWATMDTLAMIEGRAESIGFSVPPPPIAPFAAATASATVYLWNLMDEFNCGARMKWIEDWLVTRGYIEDDRMMVLHWPSVPSQVITRTKPRRDRVELILEPVGATE